MNIKEKLTIKKLIIGVIIFIVFIVFLQWLLIFLHSGTVEIYTNNSKNSIELTPVVDKVGSGASTSIIHATGKLTAKVSTGQYQATVSGNNKFATQLINVSFGKTSKYTINLNSPLSSEPVISVNSQNIAASSSRLVYLNLSANNINAIDSTNNLSVISPSHFFETVKWETVDYGVGQDNNQQLYQINNDTGNITSLPFHAKGPEVNYDVANNKQLYVSSGPDVYVKQNNGYKKIFTAPTANLTLGASTDKVAVAYKTSSNATNQNGTELSVINISGKAVKTQAEDSISHLIWSPNNQLLASLGESSVVVYTQSLGSIVTIPTNYPVGNLSWVNNNTFVYSENNNIWSFNLTTKRADVIANASVGNTISSLYVSDNKDYIYYSTDSIISNSDSGIYRVGLDNQQAQTIAYQLQDILPQTLSDSTISLVNFAQPPTILVTPLFPQGNVNPATLSQEAQSMLQQDGFNINGLKFNIYNSN
ncbi:MAG TPA: hypothetical protein VIH90_06215 [Candidatus Saccharimonadales bacterium]